MGSINSTYTLNIGATVSQIIRLASPEFLQATGEFDLPTGYAYDLNITSVDAVGTLGIYLQNDNPATSTFTLDPIIPLITISGGTFQGGKTKYQIDSNNVINMKYLYIVYTRTSGTGSLIIDGQISYK